jgi:hypothetical protein
MSCYEHKLIQIAHVLASMPERARLVVVREILPSGYVLAPQQPSPAVQEAFHATAKRLHDGLKTKLLFDSSALVPCWHAMMDKAEREVARASESDYPSRARRGAAEPPAHVAK